MSLGVSLDSRLVPVELQMNVGCPVSGNDPFGKFLSPKMCKFPMCAAFPSRDTALVPCIGFRGC